MTSSASHVTILDNSLDGRAQLIAHRLFHSGITATVVPTVAELVDNAPLPALIVSGDRTEHGLRLAIAGQVDRLVIDSAVPVTTDLTKLYTALSYSRTHTLIAADVHTPDGAQRVARFLIG